MSDICTCDDISKLEVMSNYLYFLSKQLQIIIEPKTVYIASLQQNDADIDDADAFERLDQLIMCEGLLKIEISKVDTCLETCTGCLNRLKWLKKQKELIPIKEKIENLKYTKWNEIPMHQRSEFFENKMEEIFRDRDIDELHSLGKTIGEIFSDKTTLLIPRISSISGHYTIKAEKSEYMACLAMYLLLRTFIISSISENDLTILHTILESLKELDDDLEFKKKHYYKSLTKYEIEEQ